MKESKPELKLFFVFVVVSLHLPKISCDSVATSMTSRTLQVDEDSSYDSDTEAAAISSPHKNVSRNGSETLAQELDDFNSSVSNKSPSYLPLAIAHATLTG